MLRYRTQFGQGAGHNPGGKNEKEKFRQVDGVE